MVNREQRANSQTPVDVRSAKAGQRSHRRFGVGRESCRPPKDGSRVALPDSLVENGIGLVGGNETCPEYIFAGRQYGHRQTIVGNVPMDEVKETMTSGIQACRNACPGDFALGWIGNTKA